MTLSIECPTYTFNGELDTSPLEGIEMRPHSMKYEV